MTRKAIWAGAVRSLAVTIAAGGIMIAALAPAGAQTVDKGKHMIEGVRDARYCEIIPVVRKGFRLVGTVYNTLGLNDCPPTVWDKITEDAMRKRFGALMVVLNGPRHFVMDAIGAEGGTASGATVDAGGLALTARATIKLRLDALSLERCVARRGWVEPLRNPSYASTALYDVARFRPTH